MSSITRTLACMVGLVGMIGLSACLKPNPLLDIELAGDGQTDTDTDTDDDPQPDLLDSGACESPPEIELECGLCLIGSCCTSLEPCGDDPICVCETACVFTGENPQMCRILCSAMTPSDPEPLAPLLQCAEQQCPDCFVD